MLKVLLISLALLAGCASDRSVTAFSGGCTNRSLMGLLDSTDLKGLFQGMSSELCPASCREAGETDPARPGCPGEARGASVLVTDFVDLQSFVPNPPGLLMGEVMRTALNNVCNYQVLQGEFAKYFTLSEGGLMALTRRASEIKNPDYIEREAIVGTYSYLSNNKLMIFAKRIDTRTGKVARMVSREVDYSCWGRSARYAVH